MIEILTGNKILYNTINGYFVNISKLQKLLGVGPVGAVISFVMLLVAVWKVFPLDMAQ